MLWSQTPGGRQHPATLFCFSAGSIVFHYSIVFQNSCLNMFLFCSEHCQNMFMFNMETRAKS
eukprot:COSAG02_NODE_45664_length_355_cov_0.722656_1_plen_61_part_10